MPIVEVLINSFKTHSAINTDTFALPTPARSQARATMSRACVRQLSIPQVPAVQHRHHHTVRHAHPAVHVHGRMVHLPRRGRFSRLFYLGCVFSMIVPFQMVMFPLVSVAKRPLSQHTVDHPRHLPRLRRGPRRVHVLRLRQEPAARDRGGRRDRRLRPDPHVLQRRPAHAAPDAHLRRHSRGHVGVERLPPASLVLDINEYKTIPIHVQYLQGSYGTADLAQRWPS